MLEVGLWHPVPLYWISKKTIKVVVFHRRLRSHLFYTLYVFSQCQTRVKLNHFRVHRLILEVTLAFRSTFHFNCTSPEAGRRENAVLELHPKSLNFVPSPWTSSQGSELHPKAPELRPKGPGLRPRVLSVDPKSLSINPQHSAFYQRWGKLNCILHHLYWRGGTCLKWNIFNRASDFQCDLSIAPRTRYQSSPRHFLLAALWPQATLRQSAPQPSTLSGGISTYLKHPIPRVPTPFRALQWPCGSPRDHHGHCCL